MAGIYVHVPFCRRACHYCDFHFTTNLKNSDLLVDAILKEIELRKNYLQSEKIETIYFGGGTPSLLATTDIERILKRIHDAQSVADEIELTLEANPEDLSLEKLFELKQIGINRLSLGTQSFIDSELKWMNRMHTAEQAVESIKNAQDIGFNNISIDLIFGLPEQTEQDWELNLKTAIGLDIQHISSYSLTVEPKTVLHNRIKKGQQKTPDEHSSARFFEMNMEFLPANEFEHYEISNFAKEGFISKHNSSYWLGKKYLGLGPSAHSFNGAEREWNVRSNGAFMQKIGSGEPFSESEKLSVKDRINEQIMIGLRTKWGVQRSVVDEIEPKAWQSILNNAKQIVDSEIRIQSDVILLTDAGKQRADLLTAALFLE